jgi:hypothetical protein
MLLRQLTSPIVSQEIQLMKERVAEMEREASKLRELQAAAESANADSEMDGSGVPMETEEDKALIDSRSVYVGNVRFLCVDLPILMAYSLNSTRLTTVLRQRRSKDIFRRAVQLTVSQSSVTNSLAIQRGAYPDIFELETRCTHLWW